MIRTSPPWPLRTPSASTILRTRLLGQPIQPVSYGLSRRLKLVSVSEQVRASRDGDWFHYYWASLQALALLEPDTDLLAIQVEGVPPEEQVEGEEVIDLAEYFGGPDAASCTSFRYTQLKHSTLRTEQEITASELRKMLEKFAKVYQAQLDLGGGDKIEFAFVANRRLNLAVRTSITELAARRTSFTYGAEAGLLRRYIGLTDTPDLETEFLQRLQIRDDEPGLAELEMHVYTELQQYLPGGGTGTEMTLLREAVARRATSLAEDQRLEKADVLHALRTNEEELFPAPNSIERIPALVPTENIRRVVDELKSAGFNKFLVTAVGGIGKSVLTTVIGDALPPGSVTLVYDCFAGGDYRKVSSQRHEHRTGLTQISNELAAKGLCIPLVPTDAAVGDYMTVFMRRIRNAADQLQRAQPDALLTVVIDAADNAAMAADEAGQRTFVRDLYREDWPANSRIVQLCRPERKPLLNLPASGVLEIELEGFGIAETRVHLQTRFDAATERQAAEFMALSDGNPRVQAMAMESADDVDAALSAIQIAKDGAGPVLDSMLEKQVAAVTDQGHLMRDELARLCSALATLPPPIPLDVLGEVTQLDPNAVRSFAAALGRGLHATASTVQFRDEPTETWFRSTHGLADHDRAEFTTRIGDLANRWSYVAVAQPQLMFEAKMYDQLVELALSASGLPGNADELHAHEIARERAKFALSAMLRQGRLADASLLAVRAGALSSGHSRKMTLFRTHSDLAARFLGAEAIENLCAGRDLAADWPGSNLHVEAALMSPLGEFQDIARGRMRSAVNNIIAILRLPEDENRYRRDVTANDVADLALAAFNLDGPEGALAFISMWRPKQFVRNVTTKMCRRLADAGRSDEIQALVTSAVERRHVMVSAVDVLYMYNSELTGDTTVAMVEALAKRDRPFKSDTTYRNRDFGIASIVWTVAHALKDATIGPERPQAILERCLPEVLPDYVASRSMGHPLVSLMLGFALRAHLRGDPLTVEAIASEKVRRELSKQEHGRDSTTREFIDSVPRLIPWAECWVDAMVHGPTPDVVGRLQTLASELPTISDYNTPYAQINAQAEIAVRTLALVNDEDSTARFMTWYSKGQPWLSPSSRSVARIAGRFPHLETLALTVTTQAQASIQTDKTDADTRVEDLVAFARTLLASNPSEAAALFNYAVQEADKVGDDLYARWRSLIITAKALPPGCEPARAYRLFQVGEELDRSIDLHVAELGKAVHHLHVGTYFAATSRSRDRRTLRFEHMLDAGFVAASGQDADQVARLALYAFDPPAPWRPTVDRLQDGAQALGRQVLSHFTRFEWTQAERTSESSNRPLALGVFDGEPAAAPQPVSERFAHCDFTTEDGWNEALDALGWREDARQELARLALEKHATRRPELIDALSKSTRANASDFAVVAAVAKESGVLTAGLKQALGRLAEAAAARFAPRFCTRDYDDRDLAALAKACDADFGHLNDLAFAELGQNAHQLSYRDYFYLAARLAERLQPAATGAVFDSLSDLFEELAPETTSSDGAFDDLVQPPEPTPVALAGLIWTALGDTAMEIRWRAAHSVLLLVKLGREHELHALLEYARGGCSAEPFVDQRLPFYGLHARMWLLLALARAGYEANREVLTCFVPWLAEVVMGTAHAVNQELAQQALTALTEGKPVAPGSAVETALATLLHAPAHEMDWTERDARPNPLLQSPDPETEAGDDGDDGPEPIGKRRFFFDFEQYWCERVADAFGTRAADIVRRASELAVSMDGYDLWAADEDPRRGLDVFGEESTYPHKSSWPRQDTLSFYMAVHALFGVAAELAKSSSPYKEPELPYGSYTEWLAHFLPTNPNGRWLADRRDPPPIPSPDVHFADASEQQWPSSITRDTFAERAGIGRDWIVVAALVDTDLDRFSEDLYVNSALVDPQAGRSLLIAAMTSSVGPDGYHLPTTENESDRPETPPFRLTPWLSRRYAGEGIDASDPFGTGIKARPVQPDPNVAQQFSLTTDDDCRAWLKNGVPVFRSRVWRNRNPYTRARDTGTDGEILEVRHDFLLEVLRELDASFVLQVEMRRDINREYYERKKDDEFEWLQRSCDMYLVDQAGTWSRY